MRNFGRPLATITLILGVALLTCGWLLPHAISSDRPVPLDLSASTLTLHDEDATVGAAYPASDGKTTQAPVQKQFNITLSEPADEQNAAARVGVSTSRTDVEDDAAALLNAEVWNFTVDRLSGEVKGDAQVVDTPATPPGKVEGMKIWVKFPQYMEQRDYEYFDDQIRESIPAKFTGTVNKKDSDGDEHELYVLKQDILKTKVGDHYNSMWNKTTVERDGEQVEGDLMYSGTRTMAVEPRTGLIVSLTEDLDAHYEDADGEKIDDLLVFDGKTTDAVESDMLDQADELGHMRDSNMWGLVLKIVGAIVTAASLIALAVFRWRR